MTTGDPRGEAPTGVSVVLALVIGVAIFLSLAILGLGMLSFFTDVDIIDVPGMGLWPGIVGMAIAVLVFALVLRSLLARRHPSFPPVVVVGLIATLAHLVAVWLGALLSGVGLAPAASAVSQLVVRGSSLVVLLAAVIGAWIAVALRRTTAGAPRWPWERDDEE